MNARMLIVTQGEYSDYSVVAAIEWISDEQPEEVYKNYQAKVLPKSPHRWGGERDDDDKDVNEWHFMRWLVEAGHAKECPLQEWHIGSYGRANEGKDAIPSDIEWEKP